MKIKKFFSILILFISFQASAKVEFGLSCREKTDEMGGVQDYSFFSLGQFSEIFMDKEFKYERPKEIWWTKLQRVTATDSRYEYKPVDYSSEAKESLYGKSQPDEYTLDRVSLKISRTFFIPPSIRLPQGMSTGLPSDCQKMDSPDEVYKVEKMKFSLFLQEKAKSNKAKQQEQLKKNKI